MYNQLVYLIIVLLLFGVQRQSAAPPHWPDALYITALFCFFVFYCRQTFEKLKRAAARGIPVSVLSRAHFRWQTLLSVMAIGIIAVYLYGFNLSGFLRVIPGYDSYMTISGMAGLAIFLLHLSVIWFWSHSTYQIVYGSKITRVRLIKGQLSFTSVILVPWFLISTASDLLQYAKAPSFMASDLGQILLISLMLVGFVLLGPWLIVRMWGCKPLPDDYVKVELERFCREHDFRTGGLLLWSVFGTEILTAGIVGILPGLRYIMITSGLLKILNVDELKAVVAHEMGHVRKKHMLLFVFLFILFVVFANDLSGTLTSLALSNRTIFNLAAAFGDSVLSAYSYVSDLVLIALMIIFLRFVFGYFLRNSERQADLYAMELVGNPKHLISSLEKIAFHSGRIEDLPSWHHYSIRQRIDFLMDAFDNRALIRRHDRKLRFAALIFAAVMSVSLFADWKANTSGIVKDLQFEVNLRALERAISRDPGNAEYLGIYGALLYEKGRYSEAESVLRAALTHDADNASVLNNLAWLYATGPSPFRNPGEALELALKAVSLSPTVEYLDTLAEAYYINGRYADALAAIEEALSEDAGGAQQNYLIGQRDKFQKALTGKLRGV